jgi:hypothetical protein
MGDGTGDPGNDQRRMLAWICVSLLSGGVGLFCAGLLTGSQGAILTLTLVSLLMVLAALIAGALSWKTRWVRVVVILCAALAIVVELVFAYVFLLAAGFSQMR